MNEWNLFMVNTVQMVLSVCIGGKAHLVIACHAVLSEILDYYLTSTSRNT